MKTYLIKALALFLVLSVPLGLMLVIEGFTGAVDYKLAALLLAGSAIFAGLLATAQKHLELAVGKALFQEKHDAYETLTAFSHAMASILDLPTLTETILSTLKKVLHPQSVSLFLLDNEKD